MLVSSGLLSLSLFCLRFFLLFLSRPRSYLSDAVLYKCEGYVGRGKVDGYPCCVRLYRVRGHAPRGCEIRC